MLHAVRTTIRLRKDLLDQSKLLAIQQGTSVQQVINDALDQRFARSSQRRTRREIMASIDLLREEILRKYGHINTQELVDENKRELQERTDRLFKYSGKK